MTVNPSSPVASSSETSNDGASSAAAATERTPEATPEDRAREAVAMALPHLDGEDLARIDTALSSAGLRVVDATEYEQLRTSVASSDDSSVLAADAAEHEVLVAERDALVEWCVLAEHRAAEHEGLRAENERMMQRVADARERLNEMRRMGDVGLTIFYRFDALLAAVVDGPPAEDADDPNEENTP